MKVSIGERIKELRLERDMTQTELSKALGKSDSVSRMWELGKSKPDIDTLVELAHFFDCTTDYLLGLSNYKNLETRKVQENEINNLYSSINNFQEQQRNSLLDIINLLCLNLKNYKDYPGPRDIYLNTLRGIIGNMGSVSRIYCNGKPDENNLDENASTNSLGTAFVFTSINRGASVASVSNFYDTIESDLKNRYSKADHAQANKEAEIFINDFLNRDSFNETK